MRKNLTILIALFFYFLTNTQYRAFAQTDTPLRRPISPSSPMWLIHIDTWNWSDPQKVIDLIPKDIRPYVVFNISLSISHDETGRFNIVEYGYETAKSWVRTCAENRVWCMVQQSSGGFAHFSDTDLSVYEEFFQDYPNFIGFNYAEQFWGFDDKFSVSWTRRMAHFTNLMKLCDLYGGYLVVSWCGAYYGAGINPIAMMKRNPDFAAICKQSPDNFILCEKFTSKYGFYDIESTCMGTYLSGYSGQYGIRFDDTGWTGADGESDGDPDDDFPVSSGSAPIIEHMMLTGETVMDGPELIWTQCLHEIETGQTPDGFTTRQWDFYPQLVNISMDIFRKVLDGTIRILDRREVIDRSKLVIINDVNSGNDQDKYSAPLTLFKELYRMDDIYSYSGNSNILLWNRTWFKKTGRYPAIPTVFQLSDDDANSFQVQVNKSDYSSRWPGISDKVNEFNSLFPEEYTGDLYAARHENGWVTYNPYEIDQTAGANIPFKYNTCDYLELTYSQYTTGVIKEYSDKLTFYLTNYDNADANLKTDVIKIYASSSEPTFSFTDRADHQASKVSSNWTDGIFTLNVSHNGPLDIFVYCSGTATGRLTEYHTATIDVPHSPGVYTGPRQYEAETFDYKNISGVIKNGYDRNIRNYTGQGYLQFGTNAAASVRDNVTVLNDGIYTLEIRYAVTGGDVNTIDLYVNGSKVVTPFFTQTSSLSNWAVYSHNIDLHMGVNTIEFRANATGAQPIYFDNIIVVNGNAENIWLEAECGTVGSLWETPSESNASNGEYVTILPGNNSTGSAPSETSGHITYGFNAGESGTYIVWGRVRIPTMDDNAFWVKMDADSWLSWNDITPSTSWTWVSINTFTLAEGDHTFSVAYNKDGAQLDKLFITRSDIFPSGKGGAASNCSTSNQSPIAYAGPDIVVIDSDGSGSETVMLNSTGSVDPDGSIDSYAWSEGESLIATGANPAVELAVGVHNITLTVFDNEGATDTDDVKITIYESNFEDTEFWLEPECAAVGGNWDIINDAQASNGYYVTVKSGVQSLNQAPAGDEGGIFISFSVTKSDNYSVFARLNCPTYDDDSFWVKMDNGAFRMKNGLVTSGWEWIKFDDYTLTEGVHTLAVGYREDGAKLDKIYISNHLVTPAGMGEEAENVCDPTNVLNSKQVPEGYTLKQNYPNPFNSSTTIKYYLKKPDRVDLSIYNLNGQEIETIVNKYQDAGEYEIVWQAKGLSSGLYFYKLHAGAIVETRKLILLK